MPIDSSVIYTLDQTRLDTVYDHKDSPRMSKIRPDERIKNKVGDIIMVQIMHVQTIGLL
jgi:hypothetical protein